MDILNKPASSATATPGAGATTISVADATAAPDVEVASASPDPTADADTGAGAVAAPAADVPDAETVLAPVVGETARIAAASAAQWPVPPRHGSVRALSKTGFHRIAYTEWGDPNAEQVTVCVHGLSRQGRDFDRVAHALAQTGRRVLCPDLAGRGQSGRLRDPEDYALPQYCADMAALIARTGARRVEWVGTSLGGLIGILLAGQPDSPIERLLLNDIGPFLPWSALNRLGGNLRHAPTHFDDMAAAVAYFRDTLAPFGALSDDEWEHLARHSVVEAEDGGLGLHWDPGIARAFRPGLFYNLSVWNYWDAIRCPVMLIRGETSDLLLTSTTGEMMRRGPRAEVVEILDTGHAPALLNREQIALVVDWLVRQRAAAAAAP